MRFSMNQPRRQAADVSSYANWRSVASVEPTVFVKKRFHSCSISVRGDREPKRISETPAIFSSNLASSWKSLGMVKFSFVMLRMSFSEKPVVVSVVFNCICMRVLAWSAESLPMGVERSDCGPQQNRLKAPGLSGASAMNEAVRIAAQKPIGIRASFPFVFRRK
jgi:hypothetical protein